jgi:hypothetical protein
MSHEHQLKRIREKLKELKQEQERLLHALMRNRREEQFELDRVRREFTARNNAITGRQEAIQGELRDKQREQERIERMISEAEERARSDSDDQETNTNRRHRLH